MFVFEELSAVGSYSMSESSMSFQPSLPYALKLSMLLLSEWLIRELSSCMYIVVLELFEIGYPSLGSSSYLIGTLVFLFISLYTTSFQTFPSILSGMSSL